MMEIREQDLAIPTPAGETNGARASIRPSGGPRSRLLIALHP